jgi:hypothetical protein
MATVNKKQGGMVAPGQEVSAKDGNLTPANMQDASPRSGTDLPATTSWVGAGDNAFKGRLPSSKAMDTKSLADMYEVDYDEDRLRKSYNNAANREASRSRKAYRDSHDAMMQDIQSAGSQQQSQMRKAMAAGMAQGTDATAALLSAQTGFQQEAAGAATQSRNDINNIEYDYAAKLAQNQIKADEVSNQRKMDLANLSMGFQGLATQDRAALMGLLASLNESGKTFTATNKATDAQSDAAAKERELQELLQRLINQGNVDVANIYKK